MAFSSHSEGKHRLSDGYNGANSYFEWYLVRLFCNVVFIKFVCCCFCFVLIASTQCTFYFVYFSLIYCWSWFYCTCLHNFLCDCTHVITFTSFDWAILDTTYVSIEVEKDWKMDMSREYYVHTHKTIVTTFQMLEEKNDYSNRKDFQATNWRTILLPAGNLWKRFGQW